MKSSSQSSNDITALGELLIDFTENGISKNSNRLFEQNPGGAPANMLTAAARLGCRTAFIGKVGMDMHGVFLRQTLINAGIDISGLVMDEKVFTTLAFVALSENGEREFSFARKPGADTCLTPEDVNYPLIENSRVFHFGSLSLTDQPSNSATAAAIEFAKSRGLLVTYDPNYRPSLWTNTQTASLMMKKHLKDTDIIKVADNELELLTGETDLKAGAAELERSGIRCVIITLGKDGAFVSVSGESHLIPVPVVPVIDTTGAGDAFFGGFLYSFLKSGLSIDGITAEDAREFAFYANAAAAICVTGRGAIPSMPGLTEVERFVAHHYR